MLIKPLMSGVEPVPWHKHADIMTASSKLSLKSTATVQYYLPGLLLNHHKTTTMKQTVHKASKTRSMFIIKDDHKNSTWYATLPNHALPFFIKEHNSIPVCIAQAPGLLLENNGAPCIKLENPPFHYSSTPSVHSAMWIGWPLIIPWSTISAVDALKRDQSIKYTHVKIEMFQFDAFKWLSGLHTSYTYFFFIYFLIGLFICILPSKQLPFNVCSPYSFSSLTCMSAWWLLSLSTSAQWKQGITGSPEGLFCG